MSKKTYIAAVLADLHLRSKTPPMRTEKDFFSYQVDRLRWVLDRCQKKGIDGLIISGDVFDKFDDYSPRMHEKLVELKKDFPRLFICTVVGNHDVPGGNRERLSGTSLGILFDTGLMHRLDSQTSEFFLNYGWVWITGVDWGTQEMEDLMAGTYRPPLASSRGIPNIVVAHAPIGPEKKDYCMGVHDVNVEGFDFLILGDQHEGHDTVVCNDVLIVNPGAFTLMKSSDRYRTPKVGFLYEQNGRYGVEYEDIPQTNMDQAFKIKVIEEKTQITAKNYIAGIAQAAAMEKGKTGVELVKEIAENAGFSEEALCILVNEISTHS